MSEFSRETLLNIIETDHVQCGEASALARMALAAMDSEHEYLPLDYLQGHKDGLEWAARLAEANHPETGDWLYDDPIELAKAIRKGPDMPPVQPVADSEPDRNPVLAYADSYRDMANQGIESVTIWNVITDLERNIAPLYRHAQPAKTVQPVMFIDGDISSEDADKLAKVIRELHEKDERPLAKMARIIRENPHPTNECDMPKAQPALVLPGWIPVIERMPPRIPGTSIEYLVYETLNDNVQHDYWNVPEGNRSCQAFWNHYGDSVTHWQPLPEPPQEQKPCNPTSSAD